MIFGKFAGAIISMSERPLDLYTATFKYKDVSNPRFKTRK